jgi:hypothetical protein
MFSTMGSGCLITLIINNPGAYFEVLFRINHVYYTKLGLFNYITTKTQHAYNQQYAIYNLN